MSLREFARDWSLFLIVLSASILIGQVCILPFAYIDGVGKAKWAKETLDVEMEWYEAFALTISDIKEMKKTNPEE